MSAKEASIHESGSTADEEPTIHDWNFEQILTDTGCFGDWNTLELPKPQNWNELRSMLVENPVQCTESDLKEFVNKRGLGRNERTINVTKLFPGILDSDAIPHEQDQDFDNLEPSIDGLPDAKPDFFDGMFPAQVDSQVLQGLSRFIMPSTQSGAPVLPNFTLNAMSSDSYALALKRRALYNGTLGARAIHQAQCYQQEPSFDGHAYTISVTLYDDVLRNYATHPGLHAGLVHYYKNQLHAYMLDSTNSQSFKRGLTALRNARLWAKGQGEKIVETANSRIDATTLIRPPSSSGTSSGTLAGSQSMNEIVESSVATTKRKAPQTVETQQSKRPKA